MKKRSLATNRTGLLVQLCHNKAFKLSPGCSSPLSKNRLQYPVVKKVNLAGLGQTFC